MRKKIIDALANGNVKNLFENMPDKYFYWVIEERNEDYEWTLRVNHRGNPKNSREVRGRGNWEDYLTEDERQYLRMCDKMGRWCCLIYAYAYDNEKKDN